MIKRNCKLIWLLLIGVSLHAHNEKLEINVYKTAVAVEVEVLAMPSKKFAEGALVEVLSVDQKNTLLKQRVQNNSVYFSKPNNDYMIMVYSENKRYQVCENMPNTALYVPPFLVLFFFVAALYIIYNSNRKRVKQIFK